MSCSRIGEVSGFVLELAGRYANYRGHLLLASAQSKCLIYFKLVCATQNTLTLFSGNVCTGQKYSCL